MLRGSIIDERKESSETERVNLEHFLDIFFRSNVLIIEVLFGVVLGGVIFLTIRWFTQSEDASSSTSLQSLEQGIKKILENYIFFHYLN
jgi:hypothetical protein